MTVFKKILASTIAASTMVSVGTTIFAVDSGFCMSWNVNYTNGEPSSISKQVDIKYLYYYAGGYQTTCTGFNGNGDGYVSVQVNDKQKWMITGVGTVPVGESYIPYSESVNDEVCFHVTAIGNRISADGTIHIYGYKP